MKKIILYLTICLFLFFTCQIPNAEALSCAEPSHPMEEIGYSEIVFKGTLVSETNGKLYFEVDKVWKGEVGNKLTLYQNFWTEFIMGNEYIVFVGKDEGKLRPKLCGNTGLASQNIEELLGDPIPVVQKEKVAPSWIIILITIGTVFGVMSFYWLRKRLKLNKMK